MGATGSAQGGARERFVVTEAERRVADLSRLRSTRSSLADCRDGAVLVSHVRAERAEGICTPGAARDHRYRVSFYPRTSPGARP